MDNISSLNITQSGNTSTGGVGHVVFIAGDPKHCSINTNWSSLSMFRIYIILAWNKKEYIKRQ